MSISASWRHMLPWWGWVLWWACGAWSHVSIAAEGMWPPSRLAAQIHPAAVKRLHAHHWLSRVQWATMRLSNGNVATLVSPDGLLATSYAAAADCLTSHAAQVATVQSDLEPFWANTRGQELRCRGLVAEQLVDVQRVVDQEGIGRQPAPAPDARAGEDGRCSAPLIAASRSAIATPA